MPEDSAADKTTEVKPAAKKPRAPRKTAAAKKTAAPPVENHPETAGAEETATPRAENSAPAPPAPPKTVEAKRPERAPKQFRVLEHITPASLDRPGAERQYVEGGVYDRDAFLYKLWRDGDEAIEPVEEDN